VEEDTTRISAVRHFGFWQTEGPETRQQKSRNPKSFVAGTKGVELTLVVVVVKILSRYRPEGRGSCTMNGLGESIFIKVTHCKSAKEIWDKL
jgi:hypothetical protein